MSFTRTFEALPEPTSRTGAVAERLKQAILSGNLPAGELLVERTLSEQLGVSKTPVREALIALSHSGLVTFNSYRGAAVRSVDETLVRSVYEVRELVEPYAIQQAMLHHDTESTSAAKKLLHEATAAGEREDWATLSLINRSFHRVLYQRCPSQLLCSMLDGLQDQVALCAVTLWSRRPVWRDEAIEHETILEAVTDRSDTTEPVRNHIRNSAERLVSSL